MAYAAAACFCASVPAGFCYSWSASQGRVCGVRCVRGDRIRTCTTAFQGAFACAAICGRLSVSCFTASTNGKPYTPTNATVSRSRRVITSTTAPRARQFRHSAHIKELPPMPPLSTGSSGDLAGMTRRVPWRSHYPGGLGNPRQADQLCRPHQIPLGMGAGLGVIG